MRYEIRDRLPDPETFVALRERAGMTARSLEAVEQGLPNSCFGVVAVCVDETSSEGALADEAPESVVGMGRIVGDCGSVYQISDMAVDPPHQGRGVGTRIMERLLAYLEETAPPTAYVNLMADVDGFYERFGFEPTAPASKGMYRRM